MQQPRLEPELQPQDSSKLLEIKITKATLFISEVELMRILCKEPELYTRAIRRGKAILRARAAEQRQTKS